MPDGHFDAFVAEVRPRLARAFVAAYGSDRGEEALAEAMAMAWERFADLVEMDNPVGFPIGSARAARARDAEFVRRGSRDLTR